MKTITELIDEGYEIKKNLQKVDIWGNIYSRKSIKIDQYIVRDI